MSKLISPLRDRGGRRGRWHGSLIKGPDGDVITRREIFGGIFHEYDHAAHLQIAAGSTEDTATAMEPSTGLAIADLPTALDPDRIAYGQLSDFRGPLGWGP